MNTKSEGHNSKHKEWLPREASVQNCSELLPKPWYYAMLHSLFELNPLLIVDKTMQLMLEDVCNQSRQTLEWTSITSSALMWARFSLAISSQRTVATITYKSQRIKITKTSIKESMNQPDDHLVCRKVKVPILLDNLPYLLSAKWKSWSWNNTLSVPSKSTRSNGMIKSLP